eukprot:TRINITY_DN3327_c1_g1_i1.p3 TRINITY_DN3327_c1_g1~~TRINITY_DN3327_c1_g1_i1.p3  ORF type:complete len:439 (-),score=48.30 TRINITY_DN3327_c1_g1_i1:1372-2688(-)
MIRSIYRSFASYSPKVAVIGGGTGGLSVCAQLLRQRIVKPDEIVVLEPNKEHSYYAYTTMIAAGFCGKSEKEIAKYSKRLSRPVSEIFPKGVTILQSAASKIIPEENFIATQNGDQILYKVLVASPGLENDFDSIAGAKETLADPNSNAGSIYDGFKGAIKMNKIRQEISGGKVMFANGLPPARCAGAPLKMCFLFEDYLSKSGKRKDTQVHYYCSVDSLFTIPEYAEKLLELTEKRGIVVHFDQILTKIDKDRKITTFKDRKTKALTEVPYDYLHFSPHFKAYDSIKASSLSGSSGLVTVEGSTLQHKKYENVFGLGDGSDVPANKTAAAITAEAPVVVHNIKQFLAGKPLNAEYNGYTVCPVFTGDNKMLFTESLFGYPYHSFFTDNMKPKWCYYFFNRYLMPRFYWRYIPKGKWHGSKFIFAPKFQLDFPRLTPI